MWSHLGILNHLEEASPDEGTTQDVFDVVYVFDKELKRNWVNNILGECVIFKVEQHSFVILRPIIVGTHFRLRKNQNLQNIDIAILFEKTHFNFVKSKSWMIRRVATLFDSHCGIMRMIFRIPNWLYKIEWSFLEPEFSPCS